MPELTNTELLAAVHSAIDASERRLTNSVQDLDRRVTKRLRVLENWRQWMEGRDAALGQAHAGRAWIYPALTGLVSALVVTTFGAILTGIVWSFWIR